MSQVSFTRCDRIFPLIMPKRTKREAVRQATLFPMEKPEEAAELAGDATVEVERPFERHPNILIGTSAFTAAGWPGTFYPAGMKASEYLKYYASQFRAVEIDSTFYGTPVATTVTSWYEKTPRDFVFATKVPQVITHEKVLVNCDAEMDEFVERMQLLGEKRGPMLMQFPKFDKWAFASSGEFMERLRAFLGRLARIDKAGRVVVEIRNPSWLDARFMELLREHNVALALTDTSFMPRPWEMEEKVDLVTADFAYVRWLGNRKGIEAETKTWDKTIVDRRGDLKNWVEIFGSLTKNAKVLKIFAFANNHYALCRCRHNAYNAASRIMPSRFMLATPFPIHSDVSTHTDA
jgi:uncharacterized protein YecE (DUF72 family)